MYRKEELRVEPSRVFILIEGGQVQHVSVFDPDKLKVTLVDRDGGHIQYVPDYPLTPMSREDYLQWTSSVEEELISDEEKEEWSSQPYNDDRVYDRYHRS